MDIEIIPAIDLRHGQCVRLYQGDYEQETVFSENPLEVALQWQSLGAPRIHLVDLDGAASGDVVNLDVITSIASVVLVPTQLGGGIRSLETITRILKLGVERVILGTVAVEDSAMVREACRKYADYIIVSIDARDGQVSTRGWSKKTRLKAVELALDMRALGVRRFIYTDIARDGTLTGPNYHALTELVDAVNRPVIAAGGVSSVENLKVLKKIGVEGAIIGKALYTGDIDLKEALEVAG
ncbi:MAG: 1-(5-phosphoribosyl)-5-[(5-phosphoribosylamino)methylideneamino]imidazole-4-carboxamide isomerase [Dehalococcoidales bacterium]|nr:1-(5-phosphoribosyl)-5-[(5-phosphoribosylamino)methylideneamino]imidazole-4-carboxamide isomerase [Dehalococcoidales bacterium]